MKVCLALIFILHFAGLSNAQVEMFNRTYNLPGAELPASILQVTDGYLVKGVVVEGGIRKLMLNKYDFHGEMEWYKEYAFNNDYVGAGGFPNLYQISENRFVTSGDFRYSQDSARSFLFILNSEGDSILLKHYSTPQYFTDIITNPVPNGYLYTIGIHYVNTNTSDLVVCKLDSNGNKIWERNYGNNGKLYGGVQVIPAWDGGLLLGGIKDGQTWLIKTDILGNIEWDREFYSPLGGLGAKIKFTSSGHIYVASAETKYINGYAFSMPWLAKLDSVNNLIWKKEYGNISISNTIGVLKECRDGGIAWVGSTQMPGDSLGQIVGWLHKADTAGKVVFDRRFNIPDDTEDKGQYYSWAMDTTYDGGFIVSGFLQGLPQDIWLVKFDSNGCYNIECDDHWPDSKYHRFLRKDVLWKVEYTSPTGDVENGEWSVCDDCETFIYNYFYQKLGGLYWREDTFMQRVYVRESPEHLEIKWYDFELNVGDTATLPYIGGWVQNGPMTAVVVSTDSIVVEGTTRTRINLEPLPPHEGFCPFSWIEGVGSTAGPFHLPGDCPETEQVLACYRYEDNFSPSLYGNSCPPLGLGSKHPVSAVKIFPNPASKDWQITSSQRINTVMVFDATGQEVRVAITGEENRLHLNIQNLPLGVYIIKIHTEAGTFIGKA